MRRGCLRKLFHALATLTLVGGATLACTDDGETSDDGTGGSGGALAAGGAGPGGGGVEPIEPSYVAVQLPESMDMADDGVGTQTDDMLVDQEALPDGRLAILFEDRYDADLESSTWHITYLDPDGAIRTTDRTPGYCGPRSQSLAYHPSGEATVYGCGAMTEVIRFDATGAVRWTAPIPGVDSTYDSVLVTIGESVVLVYESGYDEPWLGYAVSSDGAVEALGGSCQLYLSFEHNRSAYGGDPPRAWIGGVGGLCRIDPAGGTIQGVPFPEPYTVRPRTIDLATDGTVIAVQDHFDEDPPGEGMFAWTLPPLEPVLLATEPAVLTDGWGVPPANVVRFVHSDRGWTAARSTPARLSWSIDESVIEVVHGSLGSPELEKVVFPGSVPIRGCAAAGRELWLVGYLQLGTFRVGMYEIPARETSRAPYVAIRFRDWDSVLAADAAR